MRPVRRLLGFVLVLAVLVAAAVWLADRPGAVTIHWLGWRVDTSVPVLIAAILAAVLAVAGVLKAVRAVLAAPGRLLAARRGRRTRDGYRALSDGLAAVAAGDRKAARKLSHRADRLLADQSLTGLLAAQAAELSGDVAEAERRFGAMTARQETAFLGLKGSMELALKRGDRDQALDFARRAWALGQPADGLAATLFQLQARAGQWAEAEATLDEAKKRDCLSGADLLHYRALALHERSVLAEAEGRADEALAAAVKAHQADPMLVAAAVRAARLLHRAGKERKAAQAIITTWQAAPHPALVEAMVALAPAETPLQRVKRIDRLVKANPDAVDGHVALAEAALAARLWGQARTHLALAVEKRPTAGTYVLLARLEREEGRDEAAAQAWLGHVAGAPPEPAWLCSACGKGTDGWAVSCPHCHALDSLDWRQPLLALPPA
ncbi:heme biosynthesis protein HemY [Magnetospirillum sp. UT-4]|uniref:heme biosynthesis protein HemY n=1 Tax=Magnetospirillum sp. UT-4 TaxID=2681467 RepID=UPI0013830610|nr:heme biosynthesis HemY N-terminal domain-containing protein [Magnetospirillum sp. UT-4]CAA7616387.1 putative HemY domain protein. Putative protoheme IX synthesis protein - Conserved among Magnetospirillum sp [Magnetospirillum sp. UT-4]